LIRLCLPNSATGDRAVIAIRRPRFRNLFGLLAPRVNIAGPRQPATRILPFVERVWMPAYAVRLHAVSSKGEKHAWTSVEAITGAFSLFDCAEDLSPFEPDEDCFPPSLDEMRAAELARKGLLQYILHQRGQFNKPVIDAIEEIRAYHFAVWVYYFHRRRGRIDIKTFDGYTVKPAGAKMRIAVLDALIAVRKSRLASPEQRTAP